MDSNNENISKTMTLLNSLKREIITMQSDTVSMETFIANLFKYFAVLQSEIVVPDAHSSGLQGKFEEIFQSLTACKDLVLSQKSRGDVILRQADLVGESCLQTKSEKTNPTSSDAVSGFESLENSLTVQDIKNINTGNDSDDNEYGSLDNFTCLDDIVKSEGVSEDPLGNQSSEGVGNQSLEGVGNQSTEWLGNQSTEWLGNQSPQVFGNLSLNVLNESLETHGNPPQEVTNSENTHLQSHSQDKNKDTLRCKECKKTFNSKRALAYHLDHSKAHAKKLTEAKMASKTRKSTKKPVSETISSKSKLKPNRNKKQKSNCAECGKCFTTVKDLKAHMVQKHKDGKYTCGQCNKAYRSKAGLEYHLKDSNAHKNEERPILVPENDSKLAEELVSNDDTKEKSVSNHHTKDKLAAPTKEKIEPDIIEKKYGCKVCGKGYRYKKGLQYHKKKNMHFKDWKSKDVFNQNSDQEEEYIEGKNQPTRSSKARKKAIPGCRENRMSCEKCGREFYNQHSLKRHVNDEVCVRKPLPPITDFSCPICGKKCSTKYSQIIHMQNIHGNPVKQTCEVCGDQVFKLKRHMATHEEKKQYSCPHCAKEFRWKETLQKHIDHHTGIKPHMCEICGKAYAEKDSLKYHMAGHVNSKNQFPCDVCGKGFMHKGLLRSHKKVHSEAIVRCKICLKAFKRTGQLKAHMVMHTDEKNFKCKLCGEMFKYHSVMRRHVRKHEGLKPHICPHCGKAFIEAWGLRQHSVRCPQRDRKSKEDCDGKSVSTSPVISCEPASQPASQPALPPVPHFSPIACEPVLVEASIAFEPRVNMSIGQFIEHVPPLTQSQLE